VAALAGERAKQVACGGAHTVAVTEGGGLWTWGLNKHGQLGHSSDLAYNGVRKRVGVVRGWYCVVRMLCDWLSPV
jgi:alpha-tubulin suppressor-like RCC1 family protein